MPPEGAEGLPKAKHVGFGLVLGTDGKRFRTRSTEVVRLVDLLDEAKERSKQGLIDRGELYPSFFFSMHVLAKGPYSTGLHVEVMILELDNRVLLLTHHDFWLGVGCFAYNTLHVCEVFGSCLGECGGLNREHSILDH